MENTHVVELHELLCVNGYSRKKVPCYRWWWTDWIHTIDTLLKEDVKEVVIYDNFVRGKQNLREALKDKEFLYTMLVATYCNLTS